MKSSYIILLLIVTAVTGEKKDRRLRSGEGSRITKRKHVESSLSPKSSKSDLHFITSSLGRHYGGHPQWSYQYDHHKQLEHLNDTSGIITVGDVPLTAADIPLTAGITAVLSQLRQTCPTPLHYRAFSLDISCPLKDTPLITECNCLVKDEDGELIKKMIGDTSSNNFCNCTSIRHRVSPSHHVITRATCCNSAHVKGGNDLYPLPSIKASTSSSIVYCPPESPYRSKYRSRAGSVTCGNNRVMSKCLCFSPGGISRKIGTVQGNHCICNQGKRRYVGVTRAVCCSDNPDLDFGDVVQEQIPIP